MKMMTLGLQATKFDQLCVNLREETKPDRETSELRS